MKAASRFSPKGHPGALMEVQVEAQLEVLQRQAVTHIAVSRDGPWGAAVSPPPQQFPPALFAGGRQVEV